MAYLPVPGATYVTTLTATANTVTVAGLNGDQDGDYYCDFFLDYTAGTSGLLKLQINGADTNLSSRAIEQSAAAAPVGVANAAAFQLSDAVGGNNICHGKIWIRSRTGTRRNIVCNFLETEGSTVRTIFGDYNDTTTVITSLSIVSATTAAAIGSRFSVHPLHLTG